jgi:putative hydrolase of the HAD superfamily
VILFDLDDTLVDRTGAVRRWLVARSVPHVDEALAQDDRGRAERRRWWQLLASMAPHLGPADAIRDDFLATIASHVEPDAGVARTLERLSAAHELVLVTNGSGANQRAKLARSGLERFFARIVISGEVGVEKPDRAIFERALAGRPPSEALFVGDDPARDIAGAHAAGLRTCWVARDAAYPQGLPQPDSRIASVVELA